MDALEEPNAGYIRSVASADVAWFDRHLAADFVNSNADGTLSDRAAFLAAIANEPEPLAAARFLAEFHLPIREARPLPAAAAA